MKCIKIHTELDTDGIPIYLRTHHAIGRWGCLLYIKHIFAPQGNCKRLFLWFFCKLDKDKTHIGAIMTLEKIEEVMQDFIETVVKQLVDKPDEVNVNAVEGEQQIIFELTVGDGDFGKVIGKKGRNISALRTLLFAINAKSGGKRARLDVIDKNEKKD